MICPNCRVSMGRLQQECSNCGWTKPSAFEVEQAKKADAKQNYKSEALFTAEYECRKFHLTPQAPGEPDALFIDRINSEKTPIICDNLKKTR